MEDATKHCPTCVCGPRSAAISALPDRLGELTTWLRSRGGRANRRTMLLHGVLGIRSSAELDALISAYETQYPGSVRTERTGAHGPLATVVHAPKLTENAAQ